MPTFSLLGSHEHDRLVGHHPLLPVHPAGGLGGLRDHRQGRQDREAGQGTVLFVITLNASVLNTKTTLILYIQ